MFYAGAMLSFICSLFVLGNSVSQMHSGFPNNGYFLEDWFLGNVSFLPIGFLEERSFRVI